MNNSNHVPYTWAEIEDQVRTAILCQASILEYTGPKSNNFAHQYLGSDSDGLVEDVDRNLIKIDQYALYDYAHAAYAYAYQLDGLEIASSEMHYELTCGVLNGFPQTDIHGEPSPFSTLHDFPLRRMFETFLARWELYEYEDWGGMSVRALSLLSNMTIPAVRTSLSKEGLKLETSAGKSEGGRRDDDRAATLNPSDALLWLSRRRGFVANRKTATRGVAHISAELFTNAETTFESALQRAMVVQQVNVDTLLEISKQKHQWVDALLKGEWVDIDLTALRAIARVLQVPEPEFLAKAVKHLVSLELAQAAPPGS